MAITKIFNIGSTKPGGSSHLYNALRYVMKKEKTENGMLIGGNAGSTPLEAYRTMLETKRAFEKTDKRQGYHMILSWNPGEEVTADQVKKITEEFCEEYLGDDYDYVFAVHTDREHMHSHIVFNSVSRISGYKYRYEKGDWEKYMQPVTDRICVKYGASPLRYDKKRRKGKSYAEHFAEKQGRPTWTKIIRSDIDHIISCSDDFQDFLKQMHEISYDVRERKYLTFITPEGTRRRDYKLGEGYSRADIEKRIALEKSGQRNLQTEIIDPKLKKAYDKGITDLLPKEMSAYQTRLLRRLSRAGHYLDERNPFAVKGSDVRASAVRIDKLYEECTFLLRHKIRSGEELEKYLQMLTEQEKYLRAERSTEYPFQGDPMRQKYLALQKAVHQADDDTFEALEEELEELVKQMPIGMEDTAHKKEQLRELRREIRIAERLQAETGKNATLKKPAEKKTGIENTDLKR